MVESYEAAHAGLAVECFAAAHVRAKMVADGRLPRLPATSGMAAADRSYLETVSRLCDGLEKVIQTYAKSQDSNKRRVYELWLPKKR